MISAQLARENQRTCAVPCSPVSYIAAITRRLPLASCQVPRGITSYPSPNNTNSSLSSATPDQSSSLPPHTSSSNLTVSEAKEGNTSQKLTLAISTSSPVSWRKLSLRTYLSLGKITRRSPVRPRLVFLGKCLDKGGIPGRKSHENVGEITLGCCAESRHGLSMNWPLRQMLPAD